MIFSAKSLIFTVAGAIIGLVFYYIFGSILGLKTLGIVVAAMLAATGFGIATLKIPESNNFEITRKTGGEKIDDIILRAIRFKSHGKRIYVHTKEED